MEVSNNQFINQMLLANISNCPKDPQSQAEMTNLLISLQKTIVQQQTLMKILLLQQQKQQIQQETLPHTSINQGLIKREESIIVQQKLSTGSHRLQELLAQSVDNFTVKQEYNEDLKTGGCQYAKKDVHVNMIAQRESSVETAASPGDVSQKSFSRLESSVISEKSPSDEEDSDDKQTVGILRRNGFKGEENCLNQDSTTDNCHRKSNKLIVPKRPPSKAKHLWINYGRKILEFAMNNTKDQVQERVKQLIGKLSSKKDFEDVFSIRITDTECERLFKIMLGKLALFFIKTQADAAFEGSKYREQMITQKSIVATWIAKLINEQL